ncbi:hypothetical protein L7F22_039518 [Adiantum nelumboides]|nr:hypothetical protein [Adiantum nelumboides]
MNSNGGATQQPHVLMFPFPAQGHINPMMHLANRLLDEGFFITFVNTDHNHDRMMLGKQSAASFAIPNLRFEHIPDGLPESHKRFNEQPGGIVETIAATLAMPGTFAKLVGRIVGSRVSPPLTCIISDSFCTWMQDVADQFRLPRVSLWTTPVHSNLAYIFQSTLQSLGIIPVQDQSKLQTVVDCIQGIRPMKLEDYISFFVVDNSTTDFIFQWLLRLCMKRAEEAAWNLGNNLEEMEHEAIAAFKKEVPNFLPIGPLLPTDVLDGTPHNMPLSGIVSLWPEDGACLDWLSQHGKASVIYISCGSIVNMSEQEIGELILGLEESGAPFLWAIRPDQQRGAALLRLREKLDSEAVQGKPSQQALLVSWAPQLAVLAHASVGLFLSHCGWNSVTESVAGGVPILARPGGFAEQRMNAHYIADVWKIGRRLPDGASASDIKALISSLLGESGEARSIQGRLSGLREVALAALSPGGSSRANFKVFIDDLYKRASAAATSQT